MLLYTFSGITLYYYFRFILLHIFLAIFIIWILMLHENCTLYCLVHNVLVTLWKSTSSFLPTNCHWAGIKNIWSHKWGEVKFSMQEWPFSLLSNVSSRLLTETIPQLVLQIFLAIFWKWPINLSYAKILAKKSNTQLVDLSMCVWIHSHLLVSAEIYSRILVLIPKPWDVHLPYIQHLIQHLYIVHSLVYSMSFLDDL